MGCRPVARTEAFDASYAGSSPAAPTKSFFGYRPMVGLRSLKPSIGVQVPVPELSALDVPWRGRLLVKQEWSGSIPVQGAMSLSSIGKDTGFSSPEAGFDSL